MRRNALTAVVATTLLAAHAPAQIEIIYDQPPATSEGDVSGGYYSNTLSDTLLYDSFTLLDDAVLDELQVWGFGFMYDEQIRVTIYDGGAPVGIGPIVATRAFAPGEFGVEVTSGFIEEGHVWWQEERATFLIDPPIRAEGGRKYWLSVSGEVGLVWSYRALAGDLNILYSNAAQTAFWDQSDTDMALRMLGRPASPADLAEPYGALDFTDVVAFLVAFAGADGAADLAEPIGEHDFADVIAFLQAFAAGAP